MLLREGLLAGGILFGPVAVDGFEDLPAVFVLWLGSGPLRGGLIVA
jgi:hypothetical protein